MGQSGPYCEIPIIEVLDICYSRKFGNYGVCCLMEEAEENEERMLWLSAAQFAAFRRLCKDCVGAGLYARFYFWKLISVGPGAPIAHSDYRLVACFDPYRKILIHPRPEALEVPERVEIHESLRDIC